MELLCGCTNYAILFSVKKKFSHEHVQTVQNAGKIMSKNVDTVIFS